MTTQQELIAIATAAEAHPRTVTRYLAKLPIRPSIQKRIERALAIAAIGQQAAPSAGEGRIGT